MICPPAEAREGDDVERRRLGLGRDRKVLACLFDILKAFAEVGRVLVGIVLNGNVPLDKVGANVIAQTVEIADDDSRYLRGEPGTAGIAFNVRRS